jgi:hypothetical protein
MFAEPSLTCGSRLVPVFNRAYTSRLALPGLDCLPLSRKSTMDYDSEQTRRTCRRVSVNNSGGDIMIVLGIILLVVGFLLGIGILWTLGIILVVVGVILELLGAVGRPVMGRRHYF